MKYERMKDNAVRGDVDTFQPEREIRWAVSDYSGKLKQAIIDLNTSINKQFNR